MLILVLFFVFSFFGCFKTENAQSTRLYAREQQIQDQKNPDQSESSVETPIFMRQNKIKDLPSELVIFQGKLVNESALIDQALNAFKGEKKGLQELCPRTRHP
ncbi:MAG: hypothetical protein HQM08_05110 [Candidatus Riflebacteria bacterium]|nr:hypothetical protein [Candidatus Riflebacteria bacterium]